MTGNPKINKLIECTGYDWTYFTCVGMMLKKGTKKNPTVIFHIRDKAGKFTPDKKTWNKIESWEYVKESK